MKSPGTCSGTHIPVKHSQICLYHTSRLRPCGVSTETSRPPFTWVILLWCDINPIRRKNTARPRLSSVSLCLPCYSLPSLAVASWQWPRVEWSVWGAAGRGLWWRWSDSKDRELTVPAGPRPTWPWAELFSVTFYWVQPPDTHTAGRSGLPSDILNTRCRPSRYEKTTNQTETVSIMEIFIEIIWESVQERLIFNLKMFILINIETGFFLNKTLLQWLNI